MCVLFSGRHGSLIVHVWYHSVQGEFPEGLVEVCQPIALLENNPPLYGVSATGNMAHDI